MYPRGLTGVRTEMSSPLGSGVLESHCQGPPRQTYQRKVSIGQCCGGEAQQHTGERDSAHTVLLLLLLLLLSGDRY